MEIRCITLITGMVLIGECSATESGWMLKRPRGIQAQPMPNGSVNIAFAQLHMFTAKQPEVIEVFKQQAIGESYSPDKQMVDAYLSAVSSIQIASAVGRPSHGRIVE